MEWKWHKTKYPGVFMRHAKVCPANAGNRCRCEPSYRVRYRNDEGKSSWSPTMKSLQEARNWRKDDQGTKTVSARSTKAGKTFNALYDEWMELARSGGIATTKGEKYGDGTLDAYGYMFRGHVSGELGKRDAGTLTPRDWQLWVDACSRKGLKYNSIKVAFNAVRAIYRWAAAPTREILPLNATVGVKLPANDEEARTRVADPKEAQLLVDALEPVDAVSYAVSLFAGLRNIEREFLDWESIDIKTGKLSIKKTKGGLKGAGIRTLPITKPLRKILLAEWLRQGRPATGVVCRGPKGGKPDIDSLKARAVEAWTKAKLNLIGLHECRHSSITTMIKSGLNAKAVQTLAGHASITVTYDRYGHLFEGHEEEAGQKLDLLYENHGDEFDAMSRDELVSLVRDLAAQNVAVVTTSVTTEAPEASPLAL